LRMNGKSEGPAGGSPNPRCRRLTTAPEPRLRHPCHRLVALPSWKPDSPSIRSRPPLRCPFAKKNFFAGTRCLPPARFQ
jgi:hypothetical protein